jgi:hypothetical protein
MYNHHNVDSPDLLFAVVYYNGVLKRCAAAASWSNNVYGLVWLHIKISEVKS